MRILFGVFDWGLGHATRDIPLIAELVKKHEVSIVSTGRALQVLKGRFAEKCIYHDVPSLYPPYTRTPFFRVSFTLHCPQMMINLRRAGKHSERIVKTGFDRVISDCRYDLYDRPENSFFINHQVRFKTVFGAERFFEFWLASRMNRYKYVIVPDFEDENLSGLLSHNLRYIPKGRLKYIGILSHLRKLDLPKDIDYFISLSGPEPQRTVFEKKILARVNQLEGRIVVAGGNPTAESRRSCPNAEFHNFLDTDRQENIANRAKFIISRPGYTTIMEFAELEKKHALLVPTPGQTEQEYLADYYEKHRYFHHVGQYRLRLKRDIESSMQFRGFDPPWKTQQSVRNFLELIEA